MNVFSKRLLRRTLSGVLVGVFMGSVLTLALPSQTAHATKALCFNKLAGTLAYFCGGDSNFKEDTCYILNNIETGWEVADCGEDLFQNALDTSPIGRSEDEANAADCPDDKCDIVAKILNPIINFLAAAFGIIATIIIIVAGIQYSSSADDPQQVAQAKDKIVNVVLALLGFIFLWSILQWILPGGVF